MTVVLSESDFEFVSRLVRSESAIVLEKGKEYLVESRLAPVAKSLGFKDIAALIAQTRAENSKDLARRIVESMTTHETSFFRDIEPFEALRTSVLTRVMESRRQERRLTVWCGAASSGQEPYSLAMLIREHFPELLSWRLRIVATDLSTAILQRARAGVFSQIEVNRGLPAKYLVRYFEKNAQEWILKDDVRTMVHFAEQNLLHPITQVSDVDIVMLRNVLIYFDVETKREILAKVRKVMAPRGFLFLGTAETTIGIDDNFDRVICGKTSCYQKRVS